MRNIFGASDLPEGFRYAPDMLSAADAAAVVKDMQTLPFKQFEFHGFFGKRRVVSFGWRYDFNGGGLQKTDDMPDFLLRVRKHAAAFAEITADDLQQVLLTEYRPGAMIGWHKDRSVFGDIIGISFLAPCNFRLRRKVADRWARASLTLEPRSFYLLRGAARTQWEHSIPAVSDLRYSITFRNIALAS
jgi:alkylated DNA repair dioxygenase AlkB